MHVHVHGNIMYACIDRSNTGAQHMSTLHAHKL